MPPTTTTASHPCRYAEDVDDVINFATSGRVAGFLSESVQGVGGSVPLADGYLPRVYEVRFWRGLQSSEPTFLMRYVCEQAQNFLHNALLV